MSGDNDSGSRTNSFRDKLQRTLTMNNDGDIRRSLRSVRSKISTTLASNARGSFVDKARSSFLRAKLSTPNNAPGKTNSAPEPLAAENTHEQKEKPVFKNPKELLTDQDWLRLQVAVLDIFQKNSNSLYHIEFLNECACRLEVAYGVQAMQDIFKIVITKGLIVWRLDLQDKTGMELITSLARTWTMFYTVTLIRIVSFFTTYGGNLGHCIRTCSLLAFRDVLLLSNVIKVPLEDALHAGVPFMPPAFTQMLIICYQCNAGDANERILHDMLRMQIPMIEFFGRDLPPFSAIPGGISSASESQLTHAQALRRALQFSDDCFFKDVSKEMRPGDDDEDEHRMFLSRERAQSFLEETERRESTFSSIVSPFMRKKERSRASSFTNDRRTSVLSSLGFARPQKSGHRPALQVTRAQSGLDRSTISLQNLPLVNLGAVSSDQESQRALVRSAGDLLDIRQHSDTSSISEKET